MPVHGRATVPAAQRGRGERRSDDDTGIYLNRVAAAHRNARVLEVQALPPGWLGKTHALAMGAEMADGDWLLFTDADVHFAPDAVARAVGYAESEGLDHLAVAPRLSARGLWLQAVMASFSALMALLYSRERIRSGKMAAGRGRRVQPDAPRSVPEGRWA
ncbi:glycosyltransferase [Carboxydochorda subterranea]|uniref:Glycosyltransferase n=1 Tax=Carboxydichorda subterranea TaxID=3109565 RepID=A0ABZ1BUZ3_9FIRM|nr:glycosyltransferase [Limnochorda sp. L945t]WRP16614.1 glycosyltransferase [Limnochorda sp. L945t]